MSFDYSYFRNHNVTEEKLNIFIKGMEKELSNIKSYNWHNKKQNDRLDKKTNFIYKVFHYQELLDILKQSNIVNLDEIDYAKARWYNFHTAKVAELIFETSPKVEEYWNEKDKKIDFFIEGINFDHKNSVFPKKYPESYEFAKANKKNLIEWLYFNQSRQQRFHLSNRLFVIFYNSSGKEHWKLKSNFTLLKKSINNYTANYKKENLIKIEISNKVVYSDIIFIEK